jgi:type IV secretory pathway VirB10-like protein
MQSRTFWLTLFLALGLSALSSAEQAVPAAEDSSSTPAIAYSEMQAPVPEPAGQAAPDPIPPTQQQQPEDRPAPGRPPQPHSDAQSPTTQPEQDAARTLTGTIVKNGDQLVLTTQDNVNFQLDDQERAKRFVGTHVKITGVVDPSSHKIHVEKIEPIV